MAEAIVGSVRPMWIVPYCPYCQAPCGAQGPWVGLERPAAPGSSCFLYFFSRFLYLTTNSHVFCIFSSRSVFFVFNAMARSGLGKKRIICFSARDDGGLLVRALPRPRPRACALSHQKNDHQFARSRGQWVDPLERRRHDDDNYACHEDEDDNYADTTRRRRRRTTRRRRRSYCRPHPR